MKKTILACMVLVAILFQMSAFATDEYKYYTSEWIEASLNVVDDVSNDEIFAGYFEKELNKEIYGEVSTFGTAAGDNLPVASDEAFLYYHFKNKIAKIADGTDNEAYISIQDNYIGFLLSKEDLGLTSIIENDTLSEAALTAIAAWVNEAANNAMDAILMDFPYEMYWFDKVEGFIYRYSIRYTENDVFIPNIEFRMFVSEDYRADVDDDSAMYTLDTAKTQAAAVTIEKAKAIVEKYKDDSDMDKLRAYKDEICQLVSYDEEAAEDNVPYGNPWQLINVFDEDDTTNVVCEGYSKAFQYLCDLSNFDSDVICYQVEGQMDGENHMWNVVGIDGNNYLVDVTNCDEGTIGAPDKLFMATGYSTNDHKTYMVKANQKTISYEYSDDMEDAYGNGYLSLSCPMIYLQTDEIGENTVTVNVMMKNNPGVISLNADIGFDENIFRLVKVEDGGILGITDHDPNLVGVPFRISWVNATASNNFMENGRLATLTFEMLENVTGDFQMTLGVSDVYNYDLEKIIFEAEGTEISILGVYDINGNISGVESTDGVTVELYKGSETTAMKTVSVTGNGAYSFESIEAGTYTIKATCEGYEEYSATITVADIAISHNIAMKKEAAGDSHLDKLDVTDAKVSIINGSAGEVKVSFIGLDTMDVFEVMGNWDTAEQEGTSYFTLSEISSEKMSMTGDYTPDLSDGTVMWLDDTFDNPALLENGDVLMSATYDVAADTPEGVYTVRFVLNGLFTDEGEYDEERYYIAKITVEQHTHEYSENVSDQYLVTPATCTEAATYYKSCECGELNGEIFSYGDPNGHIYEVICTVCGEVDPEAIISVEAVGSMSYEVIYDVGYRAVNVSHTIACKVGYLNAGGTYTAITAAANGDGSYNFIVPEGVNSLVIVVKGDINCDGKINSSDKAYLNSILLEKITADVRDSFVADMNNNNSLASNDKAMLNAALLGKEPIDW